MGNRNSKKDKSKDRTQTVVGESPPQTKKVSEKESPIEVVKQSTEKATPTPKSKKNESIDSNGVSKKKIIEMFEKYTQNKDEIMGPEAVMAFCEDLEVDPEDISVLVLAWHFNAETMCYFKKEEFVKGCEKLKCDSIQKLKAKMKHFPEELKDEQKFKEIYEFVFFWSRESVDKKVLDIETSSDMLELLLDNETYPFSEPFRTFLNQQSSYKCMNKDQWVSLLEFCKTIDTDFTNYDENGSWPVMLDEFVAWSKEQNPDNYVVNGEMEANENNFF
mmetsp:Transcript_7183/g.12076  ORF Transcript_7183/g.12076 Transcript_7183/m.12076 type:complete len:275 (-) Transcript_7183:88-912(-)